MVKMTIGYILGVLLVGLLLASFLAFILCKIEEDCESKKNSWVFDVIWIITLIAYVIGAIIAGFYIVPNWVEEQEVLEKQQEESIAASLAALTECDKNGCQFEYEKYHNVLDGRWNLKNVYTDSYYQGQIGGSYSGSGKGFLVWHTRENGTLNGSLTEQEVYKFFYETENGGYKKDSIPTSSTEIFFFVEETTPYVEVWTEYGEYNKCSVCGKSSYKWEVPFYRLYVPEGSIKDEINIE